MKQDLSQLEATLTALAKTSVNIINPIPTYFEVEVASTPQCTIMDMFNAITAALRPTPLRTIEVEIFLDDECLGNMLIGIHTH